jgi:hypothetical protein
MKKIQNTPEIQAALDQLADESRERADIFYDGFRAALPNMPLPDHVKAEFERAADSLQKRFGKPK